MERLELVVILLLVVAFVALVAWHSSLTLESPAAIRDGVLLSVG